MTSLSRLLLFPTMKNPSALSVSATLPLGERVSSSGTLEETSGTRPAAAHMPALSYDELTVAALD